jgi:hypothetical protein
VSFEFVLSKAQSLLVGLHNRQQPAEIGGLLRRHPAILLEIDRLLGHRCMARFPLAIT